jgi:hypothetical protein
VNLFPMHLIEDDLADEKLVEWEHCWGMHFGRQSFGLYIR